MCSAAIWRPNGLWTVYPRSAGVYRQPYILNSIRPNGSLSTATIRLQSFILGRLTEISIAKWRRKCNSRTAHIIPGGGIVPAGEKTVEQAFGKKQ